MLAYGCLDVLSADIHQMAVPPHDNAAIDGYAVRFSDLAAGDDTRLKTAASRRAKPPTVHRATAKPSVYSPALPCRRMPTPS